MWENDRVFLEAYAQSYDKSAKLIVKETSIFMKFCAWLLFLLSFGKYKRETFLEEMATNIGNRLYIPSGWSSQSVEHVLPHEVGGHTKQARKCGLGLHPMIGLPIMAIAYIFIFLPVFLAFPRLFFEIDADKEFWRVVLNGPTVNPELVIMSHARRRAEYLASVKYFWSVPKSVALHFYEKAARGVINETRLG